VQAPGTCLHATKHTFPAAEATYVYWIHASAATFLHRRTMNTYDTTTNATGGPVSPRTCANANPAACLLGGVAGAAFLEAWQAREGSLTRCLKHSSASRRPANGEPAVPAPSTHALIPLNPSSHPSPNAHQPISTPICLPYKCVPRTPEPAHSPPAAATQAGQASTQARRGTHGCPPDEAPVDTHQGGPPEGQLLNSQLAVVQVDATPKCWQLPGRAHGGSAPKLPTRRGAGGRPPQMLAATGAGPRRVSS
jgi:hypothetical protein